ncbi:MAG: type II toxin-antitoxin system prevent-host-death family antitoxin [Candidatus Accumulibacter sp.]|jgi:antitoxin YefM|nr:type II toxin-antitoxin system prevent-host-death family antitoxin [Accumulibacter sp.]
MDTVNYSTARKKFAAVMKKTTEDASPILITRGTGKPCVLMSLDEYESLQETAYLLCSPENAKRLITAISELQAGHGKARELIE